MPTKVKAKCATGATRNRRDFFPTETQAETEAEAGLLTNRAHEHDQHGSGSRPISLTQQGLLM